MKIRTGFVSNSSSSSFILVGDCISPDKITDDMLKEGVYFIGKYLSDGYDLTLVNKNMFQWIRDNESHLKKNHEILLEESFYLKKQILSTYNSDATITEEMIPAKTPMHILEVDQHSSETVSELEENYRR